MHATGGIPQLVAVLGATKPTSSTLLVRLLVAMGLTYLLGFERQIRGSTAGDRTFTLVGLGAAVIGYLATNGAPNALAGVVTGIGFLGAGVIIHGGGDNEGNGMVRGVTTAATFFLAAAVGASAGQGHLLFSAEAAIAGLVILELQHVRFLRFLDGRYWSTRFKNDPGMEEPSA